MSRRENVRTESAGDETDAEECGVCVLVSLMMLRVEAPPCSEQNIVSQSRSVSQFYCAATLYINICATPKGTRYDATRQLARSESEVSRCALSGYFLRSMQYSFKS